jgi:hypothetical protein
MECAGVDSGAKMLVEEVKRFVNQLPSIIAARREECA